MGILSQKLRFPSPKINQVETRCPGTGPADASDARPIPSPVNRGYAEGGMTMDVREGTTMAHTQTRMRGYVKWFNTVAGLGTIEVEEHPDVFFNRNDLPAGAAPVAEGEMVEFDLADDRQPPRAVNVVPLD